LCTNLLDNEDILQAEKLVLIKIQSTSLSVLDDFILGETLLREISYNTLVMDDFIIDETLPKENALNLSGLDDFTLGESLPTDLL